MTGDKHEDSPLSPEQWQAIVRAQAAVDRLAETYVEVARADLVRLRAAAAGLRADPADRACHLARLFQASHDMKGQGATFGYPLITTIGNLLCRFIEKLGDPVCDDAIEAIACHIEALETVLREGIKDAGSESARALLESLDRAIVASVKR